MEELRIVGSVFVIISCSLLGFYYAGLTRKRLNDLMEMKRALGILKAEITYGLNVFPEAALNVASRTESPLKEIFMDMHNTLVSSDECSNVDNLFDIWQNAFKKNSLISNFAKEDLQVFSSLGKTIGYLDSKQQNNAIALADDYITDKIDELNRKNEKTSKMYRSIGILGGLLITIALW